MRVRELIEILEDCEPDAEVLIMSQSSWPFENSVFGVAVREEFEDGDEEGDAPGRTDVFIVEGDQLRYGTKSAWAAARRN